MNRDIAFQGLIGAGEGKKQNYPEIELARHFKKYARHTNIEGSPLEEALQEIGESFGLQATLKGVELATQFISSILLPMGQ